MREVAILLPESSGRQSFIADKTLPIEMRQPDFETALRRMGVKFLGVNNTNQILQNVEFPCGWRKERAESIYRVNLVDEKDRRRASLCYEAGKNPSASVLDVDRRYSVNIGEEDYINGRYTGKVCDLLNEIIYTTESIEFNNKDFRSCCRARAAARILAETWLDENFPAWQSVTAYWDQLTTQTVNRSSNYFSYLNEY